MLDKTPKLELNTSLMAEKLKKGIVYLQDKIKWGNELQKAIEIKIEANKITNYEMAKLHIELLDLKITIESLEQLLADRKNHFENQFLPKHDAQIKECNQNFDKYFEKAKQFATDKKNKDKALTFAYYEYLRINPDNKDEEYKVAFYQAMKQIFDEFDKGKMRIVK